HPDPTNITGTTDIVIGSPVGGIETGIMFNVTMWTNKKIIIRFYNPTTSTITTTTRNWRVKVTK
ncbi:MAG: hypothetical protein ACQET8_23365, partial [Bacillota bacterium]